MTYTAPTTPLELAHRWIMRARESQLGHYQMAETLALRHKILGISTIILTSAAGLTSVLSSPPDQRVVFLIGVASLAAAVFSSLQTFFKYEERANSHMTAGAKYATVRRELEHEYASGAINNSAINELRLALDSLAEYSPNIPEHIFKKVLNKDVP